MPNEATTASPSYSSDNPAVWRFYGKENTAVTRCPICDYTCETFLNKTQTVTFHSCPNCLYIFKDPSAYLSEEEEKERYLRHHNTVNDPTYVDYFERFLDGSIRADLHPDKTVLDFGSGPKPVFAELLRSRYGMKVDIYDPFFAADEEALKKAYDIVTCTEVLEHVRNPLDAFLQFQGLVKPGGLLAIMTQLHPQNERDFLQWFYPRDITHVSFFAEATFRVLGERYGFEMKSSDHRHAVVLRRKQ